jgi:ATP-binding cassette subfamily B protein
VHACRLAKNGIFHLLQQRSSINVADETGRRDAFPEGRVLFENVDFSYPTRKANAVPQRLSLELPAGKTVALVGASSAGKSTVASLLLVRAGGASRRATDPRFAWQRFYDTTGGRISIDGIPLNDMNIDCLRSQVPLRCAGWRFPGTR